jgi:hypothetical protein
MGLTYDQARRVGLEHLHPLHGSPFAAGKGGSPDPPKGSTALPSSRNKYGATPTVYNGVRYDSKSEAARAALLDRNVEDGHALFWVGQPKFRLGVPENVYRADFLVVTPHGVHVEDVKGHETPKFKRDRKLWASYGPCELWVVRGNKIEVIRPRNSQKQGVSQ